MPHDKLQIMSNTMPQRMPKYWPNARKESQIVCQNIICMSDRMSDTMPHRTCEIECQTACQNLSEVQCQIRCQIQRHGILNMCPFNSSGLMPGLLSGCTSVNVFLSYTHSIFHSGVHTKHASFHAHLESLAPCYQKSWDMCLVKKNQAKVYTIDVTELILNAVALDTRRCQTIFCFSAVPERKDCLDSCHVFCVDCRNLIWLHC